MKKTDIRTPFSQIITLIQSASSQDAMLINETSPAMVRFLGKDNRFRTLQLTNEGADTRVQLTKSDDPETTLQDFANFVAGRLKVDGEKKVVAQKKSSELLAVQKAEAAAHREKVDKRIGNTKTNEEIIKQEAANLAEAKAKKNTKSPQKEAPAQKAPVKKVTTKKVTKKSEAKKKK